MIHNRKRGRQSTVLKSAYKREPVPYETEFDAFDFGGDGGIRTPDLLHAKQALSQLSYTPGYHLFYHNKGVMSSTAKEKPGRKPGFCYGNL